jgi:hypothetical protein
MPSRAAARSLNSAPSCVVILDEFCPSISGLLKIFGLGKAPLITLTAKRVLACFDPQWPVLKTAVA